MKKKQITLVVSQSEEKKNSYTKLEHNVIVKSAFQNCLLFSYKLTFSVAGC